MRRQKLSQRQLLLYLADARRKRREDFRIAYRKSNAFMFPDEVIRNICVLVQVPLPPRGTDARPVGRKDWAQPLLATLMRVSKRFYDIASPILYMEIITDDLPRLLVGAFQTRTPLGAQKRALLARCRYLHLEPPPKVSTTSAAGSARKGHKMASSMDEWITCVQTAADLGGFRCLFPSLEGLSHASYTGAQAGDGDSCGSGTQLKALRKAWAGLFATIHAPLRCSAALLQYPYELSHSVEYHPNQHITRQGWLVALDGRAYYHVDTAAESWSMTFGLPCVYFVYASDSPSAVRPLTEILDDIRRCAVDMIITAITDRSSKTSPLRLTVDAEFRIPRSSIHDGDAIFPVSDYNHLISDAVEAIMGVYDSYGGGEEDRANDWWRIKITDGPHYCPVCQSGVSPEAIAEVRSDMTAEDDAIEWSLADLWPEV